MGGWVLARGELLVQIEGSSSSERWVSRRLSTTSTGEWPTNNFLLVDVGEGGGVDSTGLGGFDGWISVLEGGGGGLFGEKDPFLACF